MIKVKKREGGRGKDRERRKRGREKNKIKTQSAPVQRQLVGRGGVVNICQIMPIASLAKTFSLALFKKLKLEITVYM